MKEQVPLEEEKPDQERASDDVEAKQSKDDEDDEVVEEASEEKDKSKTKTVEKTVWDWELLNDNKPVWTRKWVVACNLGLTRPIRFDQFPSILRVFQTEWNFRGRVRGVLQSSHKRFSRPVGPNTFQRRRRSIVQILIIRTQSAAFRQLQQIRNCYR